MPRWSSVGRWRAAVLICVQLLMAAHILHWWVTGRSLGRFVLSDSMRTLEVGELNPGFLIFGGSLLVTAVFGRLLCGWVCHMGALQDFCAWLLRRAGLRPRLFRSRLLGYIPLGIAIYMFVWPTLKREVLHPVFKDVWPRAAASLRSPDFPGFSADWMTADLWDGLPSWQVAIPFLLLCGFATVYFLGARGLCRYGCPYGGFLFPVERLAPTRVVVEMSECDQCGLCTAACTAGVRVHDEVRLYGSVTDRNCIRSFDCIGVCPKRALKFGLVRPALLSRRGTLQPPSSRFDLSFGEEVMCLGVFAATFFITRGLYGLIPMLMAATLGILAAFLAHKALRLLCDQNVRLGAFQLRVRGATRPAGWVFASSMALLAGLLIHSAIIRGVLWAGSAQDDRVNVPYEVALAGQGVPDADRAAGERALHWYSLARPFWNGGIGLAASPLEEFRLSWMHLVVGDVAGAEKVLRDVIAGGRHADTAGAELARLLHNEGRQADAIALLESIVKQYPRSAPARDLLAMMWVSAGRPGDAEALYRGVLRRATHDAAARAGLGHLLVMTDRSEEGIAELRSAATEWPRNPDVRRDLAIALYSAGRFDEAISELRSAAAARPAARAGLLALANEMQNGRGR